jgi:hypothetical protein
VTPEGSLRRSFREKLEQLASEERGTLYWRSNADSYLSGPSDFEVLWQGHYFAIELKAPTGRVRPLQSKFLAEVSAAGGSACVVRRGSKRGTFLCQPWGSVAQRECRTPRELLEYLQSLRA